MPYAITDTGWRAIGKGWDLAEDEIYSDDIPQWLLESSELQRLNIEARSELGAKLLEVDRILQPLQDDYDLDEITVESLERWKLWKRHRSIFGKTPDRTGWPASPDWPASPLA